MTPMFLRILLTCALFAAVADPALAQRRVPGYRNRSTVSPYLGYFQGNTGGLNSYFTFVRPQQRFNQFAQQQQQQVYQLGQSLQMQQRMLLDPYSNNNLQLTGAQDGLGTLQMRPTSPTTARLASPHATYFSHAHYYNYPIQPGGGTLGAVATPSGRVR